MINKPFRPPLLKKTFDANRPSQYSEDNGPPSSPPPHKKRKIGQNVDRLHHISGKIPHSSSHPISQDGSLFSEADSSDQRVESSNAAKTCYNVLWRKVSAKKHKTWDGDGILTVSDGHARLQDLSGNEMGKVSCNAPLLPGSVLSVGLREVEVDSIMSKEEIEDSKSLSAPTRKTTVRELDENLRTHVKFNANLPMIKEERKEPKLKPHVVQRSKTTTSQFRTPVLDKQSIANNGSGDMPIPRHDPKAPGSLVMKKPNHVPPGKQIVDVVVDPLLSKFLREHQRIGVKFLYECVMGMRTRSGEGAILADEMGLGKTLQVIALLWTLLKQNPVHGDGPLIKKALIVCPVTLIKNWRKEIRKWLGNERLGVFVLESNKSRITDFTHGRSYSIMIIGYEKLRTMQNDLQKGTGIDIVVADEGHRLKTAQNKCAQAIKSLNTEKRIILSGTPLQNDLSEFYFMVEFVNPGILGKANAFKREFENPILRGRQPEASAKEIEKSEAQSEELASLTSTFILRRTAEILSQYLPPKTEHILFCKPTSTQASIYKLVLNSPMFGAILGSSDAALQLINVLKKLCNSPRLLFSQETSEDRSNTMVSSLLSNVPGSLLNSPGASAKLQVLDSLLHHLRTTTNEKVVIVSHYTSTLDILGNLLDSLSYRWLRLDGSTTSGKRQSIVDQFNRSDASTCFAFLLSAKSGGAGLNLIGASRLVLFDVDWNPSTDLQAMARIHRDGQKRHCHIYRLLTRGALEEKIYQRQLTKLSLADSVVDNKVSATTFTAEELRNLFSLDESSTCQTHDLLGCLCQGRGIPIDPRNSPLLQPLESEDEEEDEPELTGVVKASEVDMEYQEREIKNRLNKANEKSSRSKMVTLMKYQHIDTSILGTDASEGLEHLVEDEILLEVLREPENGGISYMFSRT